jgi:hypothetical protein
MDRKREPLGSASLYFTIEPSIYIHTSTFEKAKKTKNKKKTKKKNKKTNKQNNNNKTKQTTTYKSRPVHPKLPKSEDREQKSDFPKMNTVTLQSSCKKPPKSYIF